MRFPHIFACMIALVLSSIATAQEKTSFAALGGVARAPIGWIGFCAEYKSECEEKTSNPRDIVLTSEVWTTMVRVNTWVNETIKPITDIEHWGEIERWNFAEDGYGDSEDYVLLKQRMFVKAGWPRSALLVTVVRDKQDNGHAVLTVKTDKGEFVLDSQEKEILPWAKTGYRFIKRQSQRDPNIWVSIRESAYVGQFGK